MCPSLLCAVAFCITHPRLVIIGDHSFAPGLLLTLVFGFPYFPAGWRRYNAECGLFPATKSMRYQSFSDRSVRAIHRRVGGGLWAIHFHLISVGSSPRWREYQLGSELRPSDMRVIPLRPREYQPLGVLGEEG